MNAFAALPATLWQRIKAFALDYILIAGYLILLVALGVGMNWALPDLAQMLFGSRIRGQLISFLLVTLPITLYFALFESSPQQATWGKRKMGLRVVGSDGARLSFARSLGRTLLKFVPWELSHTLIWQLRFAQPELEPLISAGFALVWLLVGANLISVWVSQRNQTLYDLLTRSCVVIDSPVVGT
ncbi:MAG: RDD family protein [Caldilineaceae bacterium]|nr:RDD family protein [Caldilineaceae bacterium]